MYLYLYVWVHVFVYLQRLKYNFQSLGTGVTGVCRMPRLLNGSQDLNSGLHD